MKSQPVEASMLIRRPPGEVFSAFVNPQTLRKFWLSNASGPLGPGARVEWEFMVPGASAQVVVTRFEAPRHLSFDWDGAIHVEMNFDPWAEGSTRATVRVSGFSGPDAMAQAAGTVEGFAIVLCDLKTLLESGESANLVRDKARLISSTR
jgi:uncharacterized protein YndB with AHSA1/START domain